MEDYIYVVAPLLAAIFYALGGIVLALPQKRRRLALTWFALGTLACAVLPVTFCVTTTYSLGLRLVVTGLSGALIGIIAFGVIHAMNVKAMTDKTPQ